MLFHPELSARDMLLIYSRAMVVEAFLSPLGFARCRERATFLCLCKERVAQRKHTPSVAPGAARRVRGLRGVFRQYILVLSKNARLPVARPSGLIRESRRNQGPRQIKIKTLAR
jgi:hypothetical protein